MSVFLLVMMNIPKLGIQMVLQGTQVARGRKESMIFFSSSCCSLDYN